jgi:hypothetical protein
MYLKIKQLIKLRGVEVVAEGGDKRVSGCPFVDGMWKTRRKEALWLRPTAHPFRKLNLKGLEGGFSVSISFQKNLAGIRIENRTAARTYSVGVPEFT